MFWLFLKLGEYKQAFVRLFVCPLCFTILGGLAKIAHCVPKNKLAIGLLIFLQLQMVVGGVIMIVAYPASTLQYIVNQEDREIVYARTCSQLINKYKKDINRIQIPSTDGEILDSVIVKQPYNTERWMMFFGGNAEFLETSLLQNSIIADELSANLILYNSRGLGRSSSYVMKLSDLVEDSLTVARYVVQRENITPSNLILYGHSMGGGTASAVAAQAFPTSTLVIDRSFSDINDAATLMSPFTPAFTTFVLSLSIGQLDVIRCWNRIHHDRKLILYARNDETISYKTASIARLPKFHSGRSDQKYVIELHGDKVLSWHNSPLFEFYEKDAILSYLDRCFETKPNNPIKQLPVNP
ncbi:unnamed protein product [Phytomonas sp. Hart1]|nr:unnamed protein product [Phytomonas sp. Hart1]|eukprot:CCW69467.1 unnamed protein product [Phytomonas sp. isolate Hart1]